MATTYYNNGVIYTTAAKYEAMKSAGTLVDGQEYCIVDWEAQEKLVSGTNIKTINSQPILGAGDIEISSPTKMSELTDDVGYTKEADIPDVPTKMSELTDDVGYAKEADIPDVPTKMSELTDDVGYAKEADIPTVTNDFTDDYKSKVDELYTDYKSALEVI